MVTLLNPRISGKLTDAETFHQAFYRLCKRLAERKARFDASEVKAELLSLTTSELQQIHSEVMSKNMAMQTQLAEVSSSLSESKNKEDLAYYYAITWELSIPFSNACARINDSEMNKKLYVDHIVNFLLLVKVFKATTPVRYAGVTLHTGFEHYIAKI